MLVSPLPVTHRCRWSSRLHTQCWRALGSAPFILSCSVVSQLKVEVPVHAESRLTAADISSPELAKRISDAKPRLIISASCGIEGKKGFLAYKPILDESLLHTAHRAPLLMLARQGLEGHQPPALRRDRQEYDWTDEMARIRREGKGVKACAEVKSRSAHRVGPRRQDCGLTGRTLCLQ